MKQLLLFMVFAIISNTYAQNLNILDPKFKALLLSSNVLNDIAKDFNGNSISIDVNNDGEIQVEEANRIKILNIKQDPAFTGNDAYYQAHLPENLNDLSLFINVEEIYLYDYKSLNIHFLNNHKLKRFEVSYNSELQFEPLGTIIFENCSGMTDLSNIKIEKYINGKLTVINTGNSANNLDLNIGAIEFKNINSETIDLRKIDGKRLTSIKITDSPSLKKIYLESDQTSYLYNEDVVLNASNNLNLEEIDCNCLHRNESDRFINELNISGSTNLKKIKGLNASTVDFSNLGLTKLEELDVSFYNRYDHYNAIGSSTPGRLTSINLNGLPNLKIFKGFNQKYTNIDFSNNPLLEFIDISGSPLSNETYYVRNFEELKEFYYIYNSDESDVLKTFIIENNPKLSVLNVNYPDLENLTLRNNNVLASLHLGNLEYNQYGFDVSYNLKNLNLDANNLMEKLTIYGTNLRDLNLLSNPSIKEVELLVLAELKTFTASEDLTKLDIRIADNLTDINLPNQPKLEEVSLYQVSLNNPLNKLDFTHSPSLKYISIRHLFNKLNGIEFNNNTSFRELFLEADELDHLDLRNAPTLEYLSVRVNQLNTIDLTGLNKLNTFYFANSSIDNLDFSTNVDLEAVFLNTNSIRNVDLSKQSKLDYLKTDSDYINIRNGSIENELHLENELTTICVDDEQLNAVTNQYPNATVTTNCNLSTNNVLINTSIQVYPNPVEDLLEIKANTIIYEISLTDLVGKQLLTEKPNVLNHKLKLNHLKTGVYILKIKTLNGDFTKKIIKK